MSTTDEVTTQTTSASNVESTVVNVTVEAAFDPSTGQEMAHWEGVLVVEGVTTGDGREFAKESLTWGDLPAPLRWNKEDSHGGEPHTVAVNIGRIDAIWRDKGGKVKGSGVFNLNEEDGQRAHQLVKDGFLSGISVDVDDVKDADIELVWPEAGPEDGEDEAADDIFNMLFAQPEKVIFHAGRIRAATLCDIPAFVEAKISIVDAVTAAATAEFITTFGPVEAHATETSDDAWDVGTHFNKLPEFIPLEVAREAFAWTELTDATALSHSACQFLHHEIDADGTVGPANVTACASAIGVLNGGRGGATIPAADRFAVYDHLAAHLRDAEREPPELQAAPSDVVTASATLDTTDAPPSAWFSDPRLTVPTPITVLDDGRVYGHAATWGECHIGHPDVCVTPPHEDGHPYFMTGEIVTNEGAHVSVGQIVTSTRHAPLSASPASASNHYDDTGYVVADVSVGNDQHGIWIAGALRPWADASQVRALRASGQLSGDWRRIGGKLRLVGLLVVNVPGFPVPRVAARVVGGQQFALVAAGARSFDRGLDEEEAVQVAMRRILAQVATRVRGEEAS